MKTILFSLVCVLSFVAMACGGAQASSADCNEAEASSGSNALVGVWERTTPRHELTDWFLREYMQTIEFLEDGSAVIGTTALDVSFSGDRIRLSEGLGIWNSYKYTLSKETLTLDEGDGSPIIYQRKKLIQDEK